MAHPVLFALARMKTQATGQNTPSALAMLPPPSTGSFVTGVFGAQVPAIDATAGSVTAATLSGWSCNSSNSLQFDGWYQIDRLPISHNYVICAEPLLGLASPADFAPR